MFENVIGHKKQIKTLNDMLSQNNISHAYLFSGKKGIGKFKIACEFAKGILDTDNLKACPDFKIIRKNEDKKDIIVEQIRKEIIDDVYIAPATKDKKVYIIDEAESLNIAAQNALLKTLEEPPKYVVIILVANTTNNFLTTIMSRVSKIQFDKIENEEITRYLNDKLNITLSTNMIEFLDGSLGLIDTISKEGMLDNFKTIDKLYNTVKTKDIITSMIESKNIDFTNHIYLDYLEYLLFSNNNYIPTKHVEKAKKRLKANGNYDIVIDNMILKIIDSI